MPGAEKAYRAVHPVGSIYASGECEIDLARRELRVQGAAAPIGGRAFEIIEVLAQSAGQLVTKNELMDRVWPGAVVNDNTLHVHITSVRKALGSHRTVLKTESGRGYRLLGDWTIRHDRPTGVPVVSLSQSESATAIAAAPSKDAEAALATNFPALVTNLVGRTTTTQSLRDLISAYRLVTLTGPGGIGKTTLAIEAARGVLGDFKDGGWLVELSSLSDASLVPSAVAGSLGLRLVGGDAISSEAVAQAIGDADLLLLLDNCEHVIDAAAELAEAVVRFCPHASVLATSREVLRIDGEHVFRVPPLDVPEVGEENPEQILRSGAVELLISRTVALDPTFSPPPEDIYSIAAICRHLDGIPLAIGFAAACAATVGVRVVAGWLNDRFALLTAGRRTALPRHQTLRAALDWSYELLPETERTLLRRLAVFAGGFTLAGAAAVMGSDDASNILDGIGRLVSKSLVMLEQSGHATRWRLLETIRAYAHVRLTESGETQRAAKLHAEFFKNFFVAAFSESLQPDASAMAGYCEEIDNVRSALEWAFSPEGDQDIGVVLGAVYAPVWLYLSLAAECSERAGRALDNLRSETELSPRLLMLFHTALGIALYLSMGEAGRTKAVLVRAVELAESVGDTEFQLRALWALWSVTFNIGETRAAHAMALQYAQIAAGTDDPTAILAGERVAAYSLQYGGRLREAHARLNRIVTEFVPPADIRHAMGFQYDMRVLARAMMARGLALRGLLDQAHEQARLSLEDAMAMEYKVTACEVIRLAVCPVALMRGDFIVAERALTLLLEMAGRVGATIWRLLGRCIEGKLLIERGDYLGGTRHLRTTISTCAQTGWTLWYPELMGAIAEGRRGLGQFGEALTAIEQGLDRAELGGECYYVPELTRIKGEILLGQNSNQSVQAAESCFAQAADLAREQGAQMWELRAALSAARLRLIQNKRGGAAQTLQPVYDRFSEGFDATDLKEARRLLETL